MKSALKSLWDVLDRDSLMEECGCRRAEREDEESRQREEQVAKRRRVDEDSSEEIHTIQFAPLFGDHRDFARALQGMNGAHRVVDSSPAGVKVATVDPEGLMVDAARLSHYYGVQHVVAPGDEPSGGEGYPPPDDPQIVPGEPYAKARFVMAQMPKPGAKRFTDVDASTLDDDLFNAKNMGRAVPKDGDSHGHTPVGQDAKVYESVFRKLGLSEDSTDAEYGMLRAYGIRAQPHLSYALNLVRGGMSHAEAAAQTIKKFNLGGD